LIDNEPHSATARAERQPDMLMLGRLEFARCLSKNSPIAYAVTNGLMQRLRHAGRIKEPPALMDVDGWVARALLEFAVVDERGDAVIRNKFSR